MTTKLEIIDYDLEGAAYRNGTVVDGAFLLAKVRRLPVVDGEGNLVSGPGEIVTLRLPVADISPADRASLFAAFGALEAIVQTVSEAHYASESQNTKELDAKISAAAIAKKEAADLDVEIAAKRAAVAELDAQLAKVANIAAATPAAAPVKAP